MRTQSEEMSVAQEIVRFLLGRSFAEKVRVDAESIAFDIQARPGWKLRSVIFSKSALRRLASDRNRDVKLDYLRRELLQAAPHRTEYRYPRAAVRPLCTATVVAR